MMAAADRPGWSVCPNIDSTFTVQQGVLRCGILIRFWGALGHKPRRRSGPGASLRPQYLQSRRSFVHRSERRQVHNRTHAPQQKRCHSINSSATASNVGGIDRPGAFVTFRLMASSNLVDCMTGRSAGFSPLQCSKYGRFIRARHRRAARMYLES
jgi:hypothetical protein